MLMIKKKNSSWMGMKPSANQVTAAKINAAGDAI